MLNIFRPLFSWNSNLINKENLLFITNGRNKKMKTILMSIYILLPLFSFAQIDSNAVQEETMVSVYYINTIKKVVNGKPFTGNDTSYYKSIENHEKLLVIKTYKNGYKVELKTYYDNGNPECHIEWKNGKRNGISKRWYKSGKIMIDDIMKDGITLGASIIYYENGTPEYISHDLHGWNLSFYENGKPKTYTQRILDINICGDTSGFHETEWQENGQLFKKATYNCGKQPFTFYWNDTVIAAEGINVTSFGYILVGKYIERYKNGNLKLEGSYSENKPGKKNGEWNYYDETGKLILTEFYENDVLIKSNPDNIKDKPKPFFEKK